MAEEEKPPLSISEKLFEELNPNLVRLNVIKLKMRVLENLRDRAREKREEGRKS